MSPDTVILLARDAGTLVLVLAGPLLGAGLLVGLVVSVFQAVTQIQEATLTFIPKLVAMLAVIALLGHWMLAQLVSYTVVLFSNLNAYAR